MKKMHNLAKILRILPLFSIFLCSSCHTSTKTDWEEYQDILKECIEDLDFHSQLYIFPKSIEGAEIKKFVFSNTTDLFTGSWLMYLWVKWDESTFNSELLRLDAVKAVFDGGVEKPILKNIANSQYLTIFRDNRYEYALFNQTTFEIVYLSNQLYQWKDIPVEEEHILTSFEVPQQLDDGNNSYNIYYLYQDGVGIEVTD